VTVTYEADTTSEVVQLHGRLLDAACSAMLSQYLITPPLLDNLLTGAIFDDTGSSMHSLPLRAFELLFESSRYVACGTFMIRCCDLTFTDALNYLFTFLITDQRAAACVATASVLQKQVF